VRSSARFLLLFGILAALLVGGVGLWLFLALRQVPDFYVRAMDAQADRQAHASQQLIKQSAALAGDARRDGYWTALFTAEEINGWLAVDLVKNHPKLLPTKIQNPRVVIEPGSLMLACQYNGTVSTILSVEADVYLSEPDLIAVRLKKARAGSVPMPLRQVIDGISAAATEADVRLEWRQIDGDPVALIQISDDARSRGAHLESLEVRTGEIYVAGSTSRRQR
jgi:hypothetical protein